MKRIREFYLHWRIELAFAIVLYVWIRLERYEFRPAQEGIYVFDKWNVQVDRARLTHNHFVTEPSRAYVAP